MRNKSVSKTRSANPLRKKNITKNKNKRKVKMIKNLYA